MTEREFVRTPNALLENMGWHTLRYYLANPESIKLATAMVDQLKLLQTPGKDMMERISAECEAFNGIMRYTIPYQDHTLTICNGNTFGIYPHTPYTVPGGTATETIAQVCSSGPDFDCDQFQNPNVTFVRKQNPDNIFPYQLEDLDQVNVPLHFIPFVWVEETTEKGTQYHHLNASLLYNSSLEELQQLYPELDQETRTDVIRFITSSVQYHHHHNAEIITRLFNENILEVMAASVCKVLGEDQQEMEKYLRVHPNDFNFYLNIGHQEDLSLDTNRGPASNKTYHSFVRLIISKKLIRLIGNHSETLDSKQEQDMFDSLQKQISADLHHAGFYLPDEDMFKIEDTAKLAGTDMKTFNKMLDPFAVATREFLIPALEEELSAVFKDQPVTVKSFIRMSHHKELYGGHSSGVEVTAAADNLDLADFHELLQPILTRLDTTRQQLFEVYANFHRQGNMSPLELRQHIHEIIEAYDPTDDQVDSLTNLLLNLQPTRKMKQEWDILPEEETHPILDTIKDQITGRDLTNKELKRTAEFCIFSLVLAGACNLSDDIYNPHNQNQDVDKMITFTDIESNRKLFIDWIRVAHPDIYKEAVHIATLRYNRLKDDQNQVNPGDLIALTQQYYLKMEEWGIRPEGTRGANANLHNGYLISYKEEDGNIRIFINIVDGEIGTIESIKGVLVERTPDKVKAMAGLTEAYQLFRAWLAKI